MLLLYFSRFFFFLPDYYRIIRVISRTLLTGLSTWTITSAVRIADISLVENQTCEVRQPARKRCWLKTFFRLPLETRYIHTVLKTREKDARILYFQMPVKAKRKLLRGARLLSKDLSGGGRIFLYFFLFPFLLLLLFWLSLFRGDSVARGKHANIAFSLHSSSV